MRLLLSLLAASAAFLVTDAALAAMSVDLGSQYIKLALVKTGVPMEIVLNKESRRKTPNLLGIRNNERFFSDSAAALMLKFPKNVYPYLLPLIAKKDSDPAVSRYREQFPFNDFTVSDRQTLQFTADGQTYSVETLLAMILSSAKKTTEAFAEQSVKDVVITVPAFFNQAERKALTAAAEIAGLNLLQILNSGSAAALNYGVFRRKEITENSTTMLIYDMGATKTDVTIVEYQLVKDEEKKTTNPVVRTLGYGFDRSLGSLLYTLKLQKHLENIFRKEKKTPTDIATNPRSMAKLHKEAERVKQVLSANTDIYAQIENVHEDTDFRTKVTREDFELLIKDLEDRVKKPIADALAMADMNIDSIDQVVLMGGGTRVPRLKTLLSEAVNGKELGNFLNTDEAIVLGAVYQSARLSNSFKVLPFDVHEPVLYPVEVQFESVVDGTRKPTAKTLFPFRSFYPTAKKIVTFNSYEDDFEFGLAYEENDASAIAKRESGGYELASIAVTDVKTKLSEAMNVENSTFKGFKVHVGMDLSGIVSIAKVEMYVEQPPPPVVEELAEEVTTPTPEEETTTTPPSEEKKIEENMFESLEKELKKAEKKAEEKRKKEEKNKPKRLRISMPLTVSNKDIELFGDEQLKAAKEVLANFDAVEAAKHARDEAMNALEGILYDLHDKLETKEGVVEYMKEEERSKLGEQVSVLRTWMEDEAGFETTTEEFKEKRKLVDDIIADAKKRQNEALEFPKYAENLVQLFNHTKMFLTNSGNLTKKDDKDENDTGILTETELNTLRTKYEETQLWYAEKTKEKEAQAKFDDPAVLIVDMEEKGTELQRELRYLFTKIKNYKPKVKKPEPKSSKSNTTTEEKVTVESETTGEAQETDESTTQKAEEATTPEAETTHDAGDL